MKITFNQKKTKTSKLLYLCIEFDSGELCATPVAAYRRKIAAVLDALS
jgi:hypothetical protein